MTALHWSVKRTSSVPSSLMKTEVNVPPSASKYAAYLQQVALPKLVLA